MYVITRDVISVFSRGGKILTDFLGEGKIWRKKIVCVKTQKITIFQNQGGKFSPSAPPQMTSLVITHINNNYNIYLSKRENF